MSWINDKEIITETYFETLNLNNLELFGVIKEHLDEIQPIFPIIKFVISRLETVSTLTTDDRIWDAEIVLRSALETLIKLLFIINADEDEQKKRIDEYWNQLSEINSLKLSNQAITNLECFPESEAHKLAYSPIILSEEKLNQLRTKWSKKERQKLEQKWSFSQMIMSLSKNFNGKEFKMLEGLLYSYRMCSHVTHGDETGVLIIEERDGRSPDQKDIAYNAHYLRLISDCAWYSYWLTINVLKFLKVEEKIKYFSENMTRLEKVENLCKKYHDLLFDDEDYDKYRNK